MQRKIKSEFLRHVLMLMTGTAIAQAIPIVTAPILTRIYSPAEFGIYAVFMSVVAIAGIVATGRYELAIVLPEKDEDALNIVLIGFLVTLGVSALLCLGIVVFDRAISEYAKASGLGGLRYVIPLALLANSSYQLLYFWSNRKKKYSQLAVSRVVATLGTAILSIALGVMAYGVSGLIVGGVVGQVVAAVVLALQIRRLTKVHMNGLSFRSMLQQAKRYSNFPKYSVVADTINVASNQVPILLMNSLFGSAVVGYFNLTQRVLSKPISLISDAISDVFKQRASNDYAIHGNCRHIYKKTLKSLLVLSAVPFAAMIIYSPAIFTFAFGSEWREAGVYAQIMSVMMMMRFTSSPLSYVLYTAQKQKYDLVWQVCLFVLCVLSIYAGAAANKPVYAVALYSMTYSAMYLIYLIMSYKYSKGDAIALRTAEAV